MLFGAVLIVAASTFRWFYYINQYSVNLLFWDQWSFYEAAFENYSFWETFNYQHGPHKQGIGFVITRWLDDLSGWNTRVTCFAIGVFVLLAALGYFYLKVRLFKNLRFTDVAILILALTPAQYALFTNVPNLSHGAMPAFLLTLYCIALTVKNTYAKGILLVLLNFLIIYSAFGMFLGFITPIVFGLFILSNIIQKQQKAWLINAVMLSVSIFTLWLFFSDYDFTTFNREATGNGKEAFSILKFIGIAYVNFGLADIKLGLLGLLPVLLIVLVMISNLAQIMQDVFVKRGAMNTANLVIVVLISFSLVFIVATAMGRAPMGMHFAHASRYIPYLIPSIIAVYFHLLHRNFKFKKAVLASFVLVIVVSTVPRKDMKRIAAIKTTWKNTYLRTKSIEEADEKAGMAIYPNAEKIELKERLNFLEVNKFNLFLDDDRIPDKPKEIPK